MRNVFLQAMNEPFDLPMMLEKLDYHHVRGKLTDEAREELVSIAREKATPFGGLDVAAKLQELDERIKALEEGNAESGGSTDEAVEEYVPGRWYYNGNKVLHKGSRYKCTAPEGVACVWSPDEYPAYWELDE